MGKKRHGKRFTIQNDVGDFVKGTDQSGNLIFTDKRNKALGFDSKREAEYWSMDKQVIGFDIRKFDPTHSGAPERRESLSSKNGKKLRDAMKGENVQNKLREIVKEEIRRLFEDEDKKQAMDENLEKLDEVKRSVNRLHSHVSDQHWKGYFTRGDMENMESKFEQIREILKEVEGLIINERGRM